MNQAQRAKAWFGLIYVGLCAIYIALMTAGVAGVPPNAVSIAVLVGFVGGGFVLDRMERCPSCGGREVVSWNLEKDKPR